MLIVCPNCATSYGVAMASLRPARGWTRKLRCHRCRWVWQAQLSDTDKLKVAADAVPPVGRAMAAIAQAAADAARSARSALPRLRRPTAVLVEELEAGRSPTDRAPTPPLRAFMPRLPALATPARRRRPRRLKGPPRSLPASLALSGASTELGASLGGCRGAALGGYLCGYLGGGLGGCGAHRCHGCSASFSHLRSLTRRLLARAPIWSGPCRKPRRFLPRSGYR